MITNEVIYNFENINMLTKNKTMINNNHLVICFIE